MKGGGKGETHLRGESVRLAAQAASVRVAVGWRDGERAFAREGTGGVGVQCGRRTDLMDARRMLWRMPKTANSENEDV